MKCPKCGHTNCHYVSNTISTAKGFDACNAICGAICLGPIGILCGTCGTGSVKTKVNEYWICDDCGAKFHAEDVKEEVVAHVKFYFQHIMEYPELEGNTRVQNFVSSYKNNIVNTPLAAHIAIRDQGEGVLKKQKQECDQGLLEHTMLLFAVPEDVGLIYALNGVFIGDSFVMAEEISAITRYKNCVYVNGNGIHLATPELARILYEFLISLTPDVGTQEDCETYPQTLRILQRFSGKRASSAAHYSSQEEYGDYVRLLYQRRRDEFAKANPERYQQYTAEEERKNGLAGKVMLGCLIFCVLLTVYKLFTRGIISAVLWGGITLVVVALVTVTYFDGDSWKEYEKRLLPEAVYLLKKEFERKPLERLGTAEIFEKQ